MNLELASVEQSRHSESDRDGGNAGEEKGVLRVLLHGAASAAASLHRRVPVLLAGFRVLLAKLLSAFRLALGIRIGLPRTQHVGKPRCKPGAACQAMPRDLASLGMGGA